MLLFCGASGFQAELAATFHSLVEDPHALVRRTIACGFHEVNKIMSCSLFVCLLRSYLSCTETYLLFCVCWCSEDCHLCGYQWRKMPCHILLWWYYIMWDIINYMIKTLHSETYIFISIILTVLLGGKTFRNKCWNNSTRFKCIIKGWIYRGE